MKRYIVRGALAAAITFAFVLSPAPAPAQADGFDEHFSSPVLDPAWTVVQTFPGGTPRAHGFTSPANEFSLTANPGHLRYILNHMTHGDGFVNGYQTLSGFYSCCTHDPGLELHRTFGGTDWVLETKVSYHMPFANGRDLDLRVYFGDGSPGTFCVNFRRNRDVNVNRLNLMLWQATGSPATCRHAPSLLLENTEINFGLGDPSDSTHFFRLERAGGVLTALLSDDGVTWNTAWSHDFGTALEGLDQRVVVTGLSWFVPAGSYADYDYITVTPTVIPVDIDIKPGSDPNSINLSSRGVIPVAILTTDDFDATTVDPSTVCFGHFDSHQRDCTEAHATGHIEDVDADGDLDLVLHYETQETGIAPGDTQACLTGTTFDGAAIEGCDAVRTQ